MTQPPAPDALRIAAIDIGSTSIRQIIADVSPQGAIRVVDDMKAAPRLGAGVMRRGRLSERAMQNALDALSRMALLATQLGAQRVEAVATSAVRDAANGQDFLATVRETTGLRVRILEGAEEARLAYRSALAHFDLAVGRAMVMDIGGGSLELTGSADGLIDELQSLPLGALRLTEQFLGSSPTRTDLRALRKHIRRTLRAAISRKTWQGAQVIGSGGTFTNLAGMTLARHNDTRNRGTRTHGPHGTVVTRTDIEHILDLLLEQSPEERAETPGLNPARADIIIAGVAVAAEVLARLDVRDFTVSKYGIREGLLLEAADVTPVITDRGAARERSVRHLAERSHYDAPHAQQVQMLSMQLFDAFAPMLDLTDNDRRALADAALLHDIGYHINYDDHHKHSYHLISHADLLGMTPAERAVVAHTARYHRGASPKKRHRRYGTLNRTLRRQIKQLAAILRVADGLDRGHACAVARVDVARQNGIIEITAVPTPGADVRLDVWGANRKSGLLQAILDTPIHITAAG